jgi:hypothetical protein
MVDRPVIVHARHPSKIKRKPREEAAPAANRPTIVYATKPKRRQGITIKRLKDQGQEKE